tara:strand:+ start:102 stop:512 length:411 start_codon:yes stop_codon:yes gene_type:complete
MFALGLSNDNSDEAFEKEKLIFIYNASDDLISVSFDFIHKIVSPSTYQCSLCKITYGNVSMHNKWKEYIYNSNYDFEFLYKNNYLEYHKDLKIENFPVAYKYNGNSYDIFISKEEFDSYNDLDSLIQIVSQKLNKD